MEEKIEGMINDGFDAHQGNQSFRICASVPSFVSASRPRAPIRATCHGYFRPFPPTSDAFEQLHVEQRERDDRFRNFNSKFYKYIREYIFLINQKEASSDLYALGLDAFFGIFVNTFAVEIIEIHDFK